MFFDTAWWSNRRKWSSGIRSYKRSWKRCYLIGLTILEVRIICKCTTRYDGLRETDLAQVQKENRSLSAERHFTVVWQNFFHFADSSKSPSDNSSSELGNIMNELEKLKSYLTNVELQLYEANENIADLLEKVRKAAENLWFTFNWKCCRNKKSKLRMFQWKSKTRNFRTSWNWCKQTWLSKRKGKVSFNLTWRNGHKWNDYRKEENYSKPGLEELIKMNHDIREKGGETAPESYLLKREQSQQKRLFEAQFIEYVSWLEGTFLGHVTLNWLYAEQEKLSSCHGAKTVIMQNSNFSSSIQFFKLAKLLNRINSIPRVIAYKSHRHNHTFSKPLRLYFPSLFVHRNLVIRFNLFTQKGFCYISMHHSVAGYKSFTHERSRTESSIFN